MSPGFLSPGMEWSNRSENIRLAERISGELGCSMLTARLMAARGFSGIEEAYDFLNPNLRSLHDPFLFRDMERTVRRIGESMEDKGRILVHGDYDADGITSTALLVKALSSSMGKERVEHFLPSRYGEGYGVSIDRLEKASRDGIDLVITVDCGIKAVEASARARELGLDLIITDHHEPGERIPEPFSLIDPKLRDSRYPFKELAGVGVAFKLALALQQKEWIPIDSRELLDLVAFGTVADLVPLTGENRILVRFGLDRLRATGSKGLVALMVESGIDLAKGPSSTDIAFKLGPRVNSAGRMGDPDMALELLLTEDRVDAELFARELNSLNFKRKAVGSKLVSEIEKVLQETGTVEDPFILVCGDEWNPGVLGISANRVMESLGRPVGVLSSAEGIARGSLRAPDGFNLVEALEDAGDLLIEYGGHERAAGVTLEAGNVDRLRKRLIEYSAGKDVSFVPGLEIDLDLNCNELDIHSLDEMEDMGPFGQENPVPVVSLRDVKIGRELRTVGEGKHLKLSVEDEGCEVQCIQFNNGALFEKLHTGMVVSVAGEPSVHRWRGRESVQLRIIDIVSEEIF